MLRLLTASSRRLNSGRCFLSTSKTSNKTAASPLISAKNPAATISYKAWPRSATRTCSTALPSAAVKAPPLSTRRGTERPSLLLSVGDNLYGYRVLEVTPVPERHLMCYLLEHSATGARHLHVACDDTNNVFCVTFKTSPTDSTGVAHILEHTSLCGSKKFPIRDPFFNMLNRSLNTYMNAWTGLDYTSYPFSTENLQDFYNLLAVYLDASFFPLLNRSDFQQEGHRIEVENAADPAASPLVYKGVVFNEMKGQQADSAYVFSQKLQQELFHATTYTHVSGGDPRYIPDLTYEQLKAFHKTHYHPSNAFFFTYGDLPLEPALHFISQHALSHFSRISPNTDVPDEPRLTKAREVVAASSPMPMADANKQTKVSLAVLTNNVADTYETFVLNLLSSLLLNGPNSPMYKALLLSNIGHNYAPGTGYDNSTREATFGLGLMGIRPEDVPTVRSLIESTLVKVAEEGFPEERVAALLHQIELGQKHITDNFGLAVLQSVTSPWIHGGSPTECLLINKSIERLRSELARGQGVFQDRIRKYFLDNNHKVTLIMHPDPELLQKEAAEEAGRLQAIRARLSETDVQALIKTAEDLKAHQEQPPNLSLLPTVHVADIPRHKPHVELMHATLGSVPVHFTAQATNMVTYLRGCFGDVRRSLDPKYWPLVPLFCQVLGSVAAGKFDQYQLAQQLELYSGSLSISPNITFHPTLANTAEVSVAFSVMCLDHNRDHVLRLLHTIFAESHFTADLEQLRTLIGQMSSSLQESLTGSGTTYAALAASASLSPVHALREQWTGMSQMLLLQQLEQSEDLSELAQQLQDMATHILNRSQLRCHVVAEAASLDRMLDHLPPFFLDLPSLPLTLPANYTMPETSIDTERRTFFPLPAGVNFVAQALPTVPFGHPDFPHLQLLSRFISSEYLHKEIREKGGAYGGGASQSGANVMLMSSYRDPNVKRTLDIFSLARQWLASRPITALDLEQAKLDVFGSLDTPDTPSQKGVLEFFGVTPALQQWHRDALFAARECDLERVGQQYLARSGPVAVLGSEDLAADFSANPLWLVKPLSPGVSAEFASAEDDEEEQ